MADSPVKSLAAPVGGGTSTPTLSLSSPSAPKLNSAGGGAGLSPLPATTMGAPKLDMPGQNINAPAAMPKQPMTTSVPTTASPSTPVTPKPAPTMSLANSAPQTTVSGAGTTLKPFDNFDKTLNSVPAEQQAQVAKQTVQQHMQAQSPEDQKGVQDLHSGQNTPEAKQFQAKVEQTGQKVMQDDVAQQAQANPELAQTPQGFGQMWNHASEAWNSMPQEAKWMVGLGVPIAAVGLMSSLFGKGGGGMGLLGLLGLGAAGLGGAAGGLFGQGAQNMTTDALYNIGTFTGMMPEKADFSALKGPDAVKNLAAQPKQTTGEALSTWWNPQAKADQVQGQLNQAEQMGKLMMVPEGMRAGLIQKMDPSLSPEEAQQIAANAAQAHAAMQDPESELAKKMQQGRDFVADPNAYVNQQAWNKVNPMNWFKSGSADMNIQALIEKWALNDVDVKELNDLKAEQAKGAPYRVEDARRANTLKMRQEAEAPSKEVVIAACQKAARCWSGYEPVPGAKKFSKGSCRPKGSKKTQKEMKKS